jgi:hypothetical protein
MSVNLYRDYANTSRSRGKDYVVANSQTIAIGDFVQLSAGTIIASATS